MISRRSLLKTLGLGGLAAVSASATEPLEPKKPVPPTRFADGHWPDIDLVSDRNPIFRFERRRRGRVTQPAFSRPSDTQEGHKKVLAVRDGVSDHPREWAMGFIEELEFNALSGDDVYTNIMRDYHNGWKEFVNYKGGRLPTRGGYRRVEVTVPSRVRGAFIVGGGSHIYTKGDNSKGGVILGTIIFGRKAINVEPGDILQWIQL